MTEIKTVPYVPLSHPFVERLIGTIRWEYLDRTLFWTSADLENSRLSPEMAGILFGTVFPFAPPDVTASFTTKLDAYNGLTADEQRAISHGNAWTLFPPPCSTAYGASRP